MDFDPTLLRAFVAVTETGGFSRAARQLHLTQSAISHQIRRLEEQVGRPLLYRTTRSLTLTEDGEDFLRHAERILQMLDAMSGRFRPSPVHGAVRVGVPEPFLGERLPVLLRRFACAFPGVRLDVSVSTYLDLRKMVQAGELDLGVLMSTARDADVGTVLRKAQFVWAAAETFEAPQGVPLPLALSLPGCVNRQVGLDALSGTPVEWHTVFTSPSPHGIRAAVQAGLAVTTLTREEVEPGMKIVDGQYGLPALPDGHFTLVCGAGGSTPAVEAFARMMTDMGQVPATARS
ncbi:DNA-binding transcriptional regulator, LysR family [Mesorhizobium albiziae]|uniref:DNA-binding transcriptional regulator, LysR family n=1 Tax=Neomesorhizobium albiziae TaxID=335020 RepID=A0A1I4E0L3_9HYPH|nr:LysR family transcriptional regulator [Mesorhizobium albiziae]GLS31188.1 transcriptional regulator [Mesorhizobium albiziae]SFK98749.1 DNA-binding transcriptional regulator, LysR family [Mesorhizobium albiziae]